VPENMKRKRLVEIIIFRTSRFLPRDTLFEHLFLAAAFIFLYKFYFS